MKILNYLKGVNIYLVILDILFLIISFLFLNKKRSSQRIKDLFVISYTLINMFLFDYLNTLFNRVFALENVSIKISLVIMLVTYLIFLKTINNDRLGKLYKVINIVLFAVINVIFSVNLYIILSVQFDFSSVIKLDNPKILNNIIVIVLIGYLIVIGVLYIFNYLREVFNKRKMNDAIDDGGIELNEREFTKIGTLSREELLNYDRSNALYINGIDCSIIFNDSNIENIVRNYQILSNNIEGKLVNGYTLEENKMLRDICIKLNTNNLFNINLDNFNILNKISVEEYNLLKKIKGNY